jgi:hypothetical protein
MADKTAPLSYLPEISEEAIEANRSYQEALQRLTSSLDQRKNRFFDPRWLAAAQAFLTPSQTGSGFEALGRVAGAVSQAQEGMLKEEQDIAKLMTDVAGQRLGMERQRQLYRMYEEGEPQTAGAPAGGALSIAAPASGAVAAAGQDTGLPFMPPLGAMSEKQFGRAMLLENPNVSPADIAKAYADYRTKFLQKAEGYTLDAATGLLRRIPTGKLVDARIPGPGRNQVYPDIEDRDAITFQTRPESDPEVQRALKKYFPDYVAPGAEKAPSIEPTRVTGAEVPKVSTGVTPTPGAPRGIETKTEREARLKKEEEDRAIRLERAKAEAGDVGKAEAARKTAIVDSAIAAGEILRPAQVLGKIIEDPAAGEFLGIFAKGDVFSSLMGLVESGIGMGGGYSIGIPEIRKALTTAGLTQEQIAKYQTALQILTQFQLQMSKYAKGSISNFEQQLFKASTLNIDDRPETLRLKLNLAKLGAQFQRDQAALFKSMKKPDTEDFFLSPQYSKLEERYFGLMDQVMAGKGIQLPSSVESRRAPGAGGGVNKKSPSKRLDDFLGEK